ncbi:MAG: hypothetical protein Q9201_005026 [Fulgogasparrea decipioides]
MILAVLFSCYAYTQSSYNGPEYRTGKAVRRSNGNERCGFTGDSDIYGIGIRIGYYTQAIAVWFANCFVVSQASVLRSVNSLFTFALFVGLVWLSRDPPSVYAIEPWILNQLLTATWYIGVLDQYRFSKKYQRFDPVRMTIKDLTFFAMWLYMVWYYWIGLDYMKETPCGTDVLLFIIKLDLFGWYRSLGKVCTFIAIPLILQHGTGSLTRIVNHRLSRRLRSSKFTEQLFNELKKEQIDHNNSNPMVPASVLLVHECTKTGHDRAKSCMPRDAPSTASHVITPDQDTMTMRQGQTHLQQDHQANNENRTSEENDSILRTATQTPLPPSPQDPFWQLQPISNNHGSTQTNQRCNFAPSLSSLLTADAFIDEVLKGFKQATFFDSYTIPRTPIRIFYPKIWLLTPQYTVTFCQHVFRRNHRPTILIPVFVHLADSRLYAHQLFPEIFSTAVDHPQYHSISTEALNVVLSFRVLRLPHSNPSSWYIFTASLALTCCCIFIVAIELAIAWNHIGGLNKVGAVGQLVPAVLGVGGVVKVMWARWTERKVDRREEEAVPKGMRRCAELYETLRRARSSTT